MHALHYVQNRNRRVQAEGGTNTIVSWRIVMKDYCHLLLGIGNVPEPRPVQAQAYDLVDPFRERLKSNYLCARQWVCVHSLSGGYRNCDQHTVKFGHCNSHGDIKAVASLQRFFPLCRSVVGHNGL